MDLSPPTEVDGFYVISYKLRASVQFSGQHGGLPVIFWAAERPSCNFALFGNFLQFPTIQGHFYNSPHKLGYFWNLYSLERLSYNLYHFREVFYNFLQDGGFYIIFHFEPPFNLFLHSIHEEA
ncbi:hypothetical protein Taro_032602, partial [Colocasia esculenta]|nr:hypothetical protein [Colocasia esculenta]